MKIWGQDGLGTSDLIYMVPKRNIPLPNLNTQKSGGKKFIFKGIWTGNGLHSGALSPAVNKGELKSYKKHVVGMEESECWEAEASFPYTALEFRQACQPPRPDSRRVFLESWTPPEKCLIKQILRCSWVESYF